MELHEQLQGIAEKLSQLDVNNRGDLAEISRLTTMQNELLAQQALEERVKVQETKVEAIVLPYDFDDVLGVTGANEMIIELFKEYKRADYAEHNAEVETIIAEYKAQLNEERTKREEIYTQLGNTSRMFNELETEHNRLHSDMEQFSKANQQLLARALEAESKRDEALAKIDELEDTLKTLEARPAVNATTISPTDRLALLVQESKNAKVKSALDIALENSAPFRGKVITGDAVAELQTPEVNPFPVVDSSSDSGYQLVTGPTETVPADDQVTPSEKGEVHSESEGLDQSNAEAVGESGRTLEEAFRRIEALEAKLGA